MLHIMGSCTRLNLFIQIFSSFLMFFVTALNFLFAYSFAALSYVSPYFSSDRVLCNISVDLVIKFDIPKTLKFARSLQCTVIKKLYMYARLWGSSLLYDDNRNNKILSIIWRSDTNHQYFWQYYCQSVNKYLMIWIPLEYCVYLNFASIHATNDQ